ncbi:phosphatidylinositol mannoside acyltransferase [Intrasporangium sp.]|uniref:phosphatidylinositol mannoside acyltransferase n=1 Tax=Intrasporangium sp. TaxID=1925024 RepID=UPI0032214B2B
MTRAPLSGRLTGQVSVLGFRVGWSAVRAMPERAAYALFDRIADVVVLRGGTGVVRLRSNYARVRPELTAGELDELVHDGVRSYMRYYCEAFRLPSLTPEQIDRAVTATGFEQPRDVCRAGGTAVVFVGHLGNFDLAAAWSARNLAPVTTVAERLKPEEVFQEFLAFRNSIQMDIIPLEGGDNPFHELLRTARRGGRLIALASDRDLTANGVEVDLLGHRARMAKGPALLALLTGSPLYAARVHYEQAPRGAGLGGHRTVIDIGPRLTPRIEGTTAEQAHDLVQQCADHLAEAIRTHTSSWHMLQRVFVEDLDPAVRGTEVTP